MPKIEFYFHGKLLTTTNICERSDQTDRDKVASECLLPVDYRDYDKFVITDDDGSNPRTAVLSPYFSDSQGRIWKAKWEKDV